ncbi:uncharacterized protein LOC112553351 isoform X2 [Pomacea canaliculata]|uniref:uncharacterized protein LOC112553351 isoform X2 n=1 Tax=Pomacea canaliculata TaxID=400727 RepID=UPI000D73F1DC|nr:uncharacterized protein LOC112553351 isoform X2 [Pomacea canaliculata]
MATATDSTVPLISTDTKASTSVSMNNTPPPGYYQLPQFHPGTGPVLCPPQLMGMNVIQPTSAGPTMIMTQPVVTVLKPATTCPLVMSVLSSIFCCFICGMAGILVAWKARLEVLENKYEQARHSINIVWIFFGLTIFFGLVTWGMVSFYLVVIVPGIFRYYN